MDNVWLFLGALATLLGGLLVVSPSGMPIWTGWIIAAVGVAIMAVAALRIRRDLWSCVLAKARAQILAEAEDTAATPPVPAALSQVPQRDTPINKAIYYAATGQWRDDVEFQAKELKDPIFQACADIRQRALDGDLSVWGRRVFGGSGVYVRIPDAEWSRIAVDVLRVMFLANAEGGAKDDKRMSGSLEYQDLWTSRLQIERLFPVPLRTFPTTRPEVQ